MLRYANNSNYKNDTMIRKQVYVTSAVLNECRRIILESEMLKEDDNQWPERDRIGRQELQIVMGNEHISLLLRRLVPSLMSRAVMTLKGVAYSITSFSAYSSTLSDKPSQKNQKRRGRVGFGSISPELHTNS
ncbi:hypothetical protein I3760_13G023600 [Carya illinoinensis]|nr:hypothetical protein I3760_13G023600 [Carya illinoinensis]